MRIDWASIRSTVNEYSEKLAVALISKYQLINPTTLAVLEKLVTGAIPKRLWFKFIFALYHLSPDRLERVLTEASRRDLFGENLSNKAHWAYKTLNGSFGFSNRELRLAAQRKYISKDGEVDILLSLERRQVLSALIAISLQLLACCIYCVGVWTFFTINVPAWLILVQIIICATASLLVIPIVFLFVYPIFVKGILPWSVKSKLEVLRHELMMAGIPTLNTE